MTVLFDNIVNARDLGGLIGAGGKPIKPHRLLRTAHLHDATDTDLHQEYHLAKIFDFRSLGEAEALPDREVPGATHHLLPTIDLSAERLTEQPIPQEAFLDLEAHIVNYSFYPEVQKMAANMYPSLIRSEYSQLQYAAFLRLIIEALVAVLNAQIESRGGGDAEKEVILAFMGVSTPNFIRTWDLIDREFGGMISYLQNQLLLSSDDLRLLRHRFLQ